MAVIRIEYGILVANLKEKLGAYARMILKRILRKQRGRM
jgi:hypothetical protein